MKTTPLPEILKQITPLPYRVDGTHEVPDITTPSPAPHKVLRSDSERWVALAEALDQEGLATSAYLAHAANVLPGLVEALRNCLSGDFDCCDDNLDPAKASEIRQQARQALSLATNVPVNS